MPKQMKSSQEVLKTATSHLDPDKEIIENSKVEIGLIKKQNNSLNQIKQLLSVDDPSEEDTEKSISGSLRASVGYLSSISGRLNSIASTTSAVKAVVSPMSKKLDTTISLLGNIKTSLTQITGVLSAFRADYLMVANGVTPRGESLINKSLLQRDLQPLMRIQDKALKSSIAEMRKAAMFADLMSNAVRKKIGNNKMAKEGGGEGIFSKLLGKLSPDMQEYGQLAMQFIPIIGMFTGRDIDDSSVKSLASSILGRQKSKQYIDPLNELIGQWMNGSSNGKAFDIKKLLGGKINELTGLGDDTKKLEREKDPNLVMSALAPFADDIKDMVETKYEMTKKRPKMIPIYAKPVWVVNSKYQENGLEKKHGKNLATNEADLDEKRLLDLISGRATNKKDKDGRDLLTMNLSEGEVGGEALDKFFKKYFPDASYNDKVDWVSSEKAKHKRATSRDLTTSVVTSRDSEGRWQQSRQQSLAGVLNDTDMSGIDDFGGIASGILQALSGDIVGGATMALAGGGTKLATRAGRQDLGRSLRRTAGSFASSMKGMSQNNKEADKKLNIPDKFKYLVATRVREFLGYDEKSKISREDKELISDIVNVASASISFDSQDKALDGLLSSKETLIKEFQNIFPDDPSKADALYNIIEQSALDCWDYNIPDKGISKLLKSMGNTVLGGLEKFAEGHSSGRKARKRANKKQSVTKKSSAVASAGDIDDSRVKEDGTPVITKASDTIVPKVHADGEDAANLLNQTAALVAMMGAEATKGIQAEEAQLTILTGNEPAEPDSKPLSIFSKIISKTPVGKTPVGQLVLAGIGSIKPPKFKSKAKKQEHKTLAEMFGLENKEGEQEGEQKETLASKLFGKVSGKLDETKDKLKEKLKDSGVGKKLAGVADKFNKIKETKERTIDSAKNALNEKKDKALKRILNGKDGKGGLKAAGKKILTGKDGKGGLKGISKKLLVGGEDKNGEGGLKGAGLRLLKGKKGENGERSGGLMGLAKKIKGNKPSNPNKKPGLLSKITSGKDGKGGLKGLVGKAKGKLDKFNEKHGGKTEAEKEKERQEKLNKATEDAVKKEKQAADDAAKSRKENQEEIDKKKKEGAEQGVATETEAATKNAATETETQTAINAEQAAGTTAREAEETAETTKEVTMEEATTTSMTLLEKARAAGRWALEKAGAIAGAGIKLVGSIGKGILKAISGSKVLKIAAGAALGVGITALIIKMSKKTMKAAAAGKEPELGDAKFPSVKGGKDDDDKKEKKKEKEAEKDTEQKQEPSKVYLSPTGQVIDASTNEPVKARKKNGEDSDRNLNILMNPMDRLQFVKRVGKKEFKLVKKPKDKPKSADEKNREQESKAVSNGNPNGEEQNAEGTNTTTNNSQTSVGDRLKSGFNNVKDKGSKLAKFAFMMSNPVLFAGPLMLKNLKKLKDSPFGQLMSKNPNKASDILSNTGSTGAALSVSNNASTSDVSNDDGRGFWTGIFDNLFGFTEKKRKAALSSNLEDSSTDNAGLALNKSYVAKGLRNISNKFAQKFGLAQIKDDTTAEEQEAEKVSGTKRAHGTMTTSEIYDKERQRVYVQTTNGSIATVSGSGSGGTLQTAIPYSEYGVWKQGDSRWGGKTAISIGNGNLSGSGCSLTSTALMLVHSGAVQEADFNPGVLADDINTREDCRGSCGAAAPMTHMCEYKGLKTMQQVTQSETSSWENKDWSSFYNHCVELMQQGNFLILHVSNHYACVDYIDTLHQIIFLMDPGGKKFPNCVYDHANPPSVLGPEDVGYDMHEYWNSGSELKRVRGIDIYKCSTSSASVYLLNGRRTFDSYHPNGGAPGATIDPTATGSSSATPVAGNVVNWYMSDMPGSSLSSHIWRNGGEWHGGTDIAASSGTPIHTPVAGTVIRTSNEQASSSMGNYVIFKDQKGNIWRNMHMVSPPNVRQGQALTAGQEIGKVGNTGDSHGSHLHVDIRVPGTSDSYQPQGSMYDPEKFDLSTLTGYVPKNGEKSYYGKGKYGREKNFNPIGLAEYTKAIKKSKTNNGDTLYGIGKDHLWQREYSLFPYNSSMDTESQTLGDSGCGPAAAATIKNIYKNKKYGKSKYGRAEDTATTTTTDSTTSTTSTASVPNSNQPVIGTEASSTDSDGKTRTLTLTQDCIDIWNALKADGCADGCAAGIIGNLVQECGGGTLNIRETACAGVISYGGGIMQWTPYSQHITWCASHGFSGRSETWEAQLAHLVDELNNPPLGVDFTFSTTSGRPSAKYSSPSVESAGFKVPSNPQEFKMDNDPENAAVIFERCYEYSGDWNLSTSENVNYGGMQPRDMNRREYAKIVFTLMNGKGTIGSSFATASGATGLLEIKLDNYVDAQEAISKYVTDPGVWHPTEEENPEEQPSTANAEESITGDISGETSTATASDNTPKPATSKVDNPEQTVTIGGGNVTPTPTTNVPQVTTPQTNKSTNTTTNYTYNTPSKATPSEYKVETVETGGIEKTVITTDTGGTIVICNNYDKNIKTNLDDIVGNFKHLNNTQSKALKVLKAISDLIKDDGTEERGVKFMLNDDGLDWILKGL